MHGDDSTLLPREFADGDVSVQLLDPSYRRPIKTWKFTDQPSITIGRGDDADVLISDAYVSRVHAELVLREDQWVLISRGRNGVLVGSQIIAEVPVTSDVTFRLGPAGPLLRVSTLSAPAEAASATLSYTSDTNPLLHLDETKLQEEVTQITSDDYFQKLQQKAKELRRQRDTQTKH